jgi:diguanylate cyclase (GGDEF)-like protein
MSFKLKTILGIALIEFAMLTVMIVSAVGLLRDSAETELNKRSANVTQLLATTVADAVISNDLAKLQSAAIDVSAQSDVEYVRIYNSSDTLLASAGPGKSDDHRLDSKLSEITDDIFDARADITAAGNLFGYVEIGHSISGIPESLQAAYRQTSTIAIIEITLTALFSLLLGIYLTKQLCELRNGAEQLANGKLGYTVPVHSRDEVGQATRAFNKMSEQLQKERHRTIIKENKLHELNAKLEQRVARALTVRLLDIALQHAARQKTRVCVVMLTVTQLDDVIHEHGYHAGDLLLQHVAKQLRSTLRKSDAIGRISNKDYLLIINSETDTDKIIQRINKALSIPLQWNDAEIEVSAIFGVATESDTLNTSNKLIWAANLASNAALHEDSNAQLFEEINSEKNIPVTQDPTSFLLGKEWQVNVLFRPIYMLKPQSTELMHISIQLHDGKHILNPDQYAQYVNDDGVLAKIYTEAIDAALEHIDSSSNYSILLKNKAPILPGSALLETIKQKITSHGLNADQLIVSISEQALMRDPLECREAIVNIKKSGFLLSIHGAGMGLTGITYLPPKSINYILLDRSFVSDMTNNPNGRAIVRSSVYLAQELKALVVAMGINSRTALDTARAYGIDGAEGDEIGKYKPIDKLKENPTWTEDNITELNSVTR